MRRLLYLILAIGLSAAAVGSTPDSVAVPGTLTIPFRLNRDGRILVDGKIDATPGVFLLDTGSPFIFHVNRNYVPLGEGLEISRGRFGSGQDVIVRAHGADHVAELPGGLRLPAAGRTGDDRTLSLDARQQQANIDPRLLGWLGWGFLGRYVFTVDYSAQVVTLVPRSSAPARMSRAGATIVRFQPSSPPVPFILEIAGVSVPTALDTGGWDQLRLPAEQWQRLRALPGLLSEGPGIRCVSISHAAYGSTTWGLSDLERVEGPAALMLGHNFLRGYRSTWDPRDGTVTLDPDDKVRPRRSRDCR